MEKKIRRVELKLKSDKTKPLSGWQLQEFINNVSKGYSKLDLINELSKLLNEGENPENIIIMNKSYEINNRYDYLKKINEIDLNKMNMVEKYYNLGRPISMYPNKTTKKIEIIFNLYERLYSLFRLNKIGTIPKHRLKTYINLTFDEGIKALECDGKQIINSLDELKGDSIERLEGALSEYIANAKSIYKNYEKDEFNIESFSKLCDVGFSNLTENEEDLVIAMDKEYYNEFFKCFKRIDRPIILRYDKESNKLSVIKKEYILNDVESENFLDYKDFSHNSPFIITIIAGVTISLIVALLYFGLKQEKLNDKQDEKNKKLEEENDNEIKDIINKLAESEELNEVNEVSNEFLKDKLVTVRDKVKKSTLATLKQKGVMNKNMVIELDEYKDNKELNNGCDTGKEK